MKYKKMIAFKKLKQQLKTHTAKLIFATIEAFPLICQMKHWKKDTCMYWSKEKVYQENLITF